MKLVIHDVTDLAAWFEQAPAPMFGKRNTMLNDPRQEERTVHPSRLPIDYLLAQPNPEIEEVESFDLDSFLMYH